MKRRVILVLLILLGLSTGLNFGCTPRVGPKELIVRPFDFSSAPVYLPADGVSETPVIVTVMNDEGRRVGNVVVQFSATVGTISRTNVITDTLGTASTILRSIGSTKDTTSYVTAAVTDTVGYILNPRIVSTANPTVQFGNLVTMQGS